MPTASVRGVWWWSPMWAGLRHVAELLWADERSWMLEGRDLPPGCEIALPPNTKAALATLLLEAGIALTPAKSIWRPAAWFAVFRYAEAFAPKSGKLRLLAESQDWDARLTGVLAEELAVGIAMHIAHEHLGIVHVADVLPLVRAGEVTLRSVAVDPESPEARPDYLCLDQANERVFVEVKGAVGTESRLTGALLHGKTQVQNAESALYRARTRSGRAVGDRLVLGTYFCVEGKHPRSETTTIVLDPPADESSPSPERTTSDLAIRLSYAKALIAGGQEFLAERILRRAAWPEDIDPPLVPLEPATPDAPALRALGRFPLGGLLVVHNKVWKVLRQHHELDLTEALAAAIAGVRASREWLRAHRDMPLVLLPNGVGLVW